MLSRALRWCAGLFNNCNLLLRYGVFCCRCCFDDDLVKNISRHGEVRGSSAIKYVCVSSLMSTTDVILTNVICNCELKL